MNKFLVTFNTTYKNKIFSKSFIIVTVILLTLIVLAFNANKFKSFVNSEEHIGFVSEKGFYDSIKGISKNKLNNATLSYYKDTKSAKSDLNNKNLDSFFVVNQNSSTSQINVKHYYVNDRKTQNPNILISKIKNIQYQYNVKNLNLNKNEIQDLRKDIRFKDIPIDKSNHINQSEKNFNTLFMYILLVVLVFITMNYANQVAMEIATEKTSRVIEIVITSLKPQLHILAKIFAILAVALTQLFFMSLTILVCLFFIDIEKLYTQLDISFGKENFHVVILGAVFWIIGIFSYTVVAAILGSLTSRIEDVSQAIMPISLILLGSFYIVFFSLTDLKSKLIIITSYIPLFSPFSMLARIANNSVNNVEICISIVISITFIIIAVIFAAVNYKKSVLSFENNMWKNIKNISLDLFNEE